MASDSENNACKQALRELFGMLNSHSKSLEMLSEGNAKIIKYWIENGQRPSDEQLVQMMDSILEEIRRHRAFLDEVRADLES